MKKGITLKDMARKLNMSVSTVSKSLNNDQAISTLTKERVRELATRWNYIANESARHFKLSKSFTLGVIIPDLLDPFFVEAINGVEEIAVKENYNIIVTQSHEDKDKEERMLNVMIRNRIDGLIVAVTKNTADMALFERFKAVGIPVICMVRKPQNNAFHYVCMDNVDGGFKATEFLIKKGHTRIAHIMGPSTLQISLARFEGYNQALAQHHIPIDNALVKEVDFSARQTEAAIIELMELQAPPTAIFAFKNCITLDAIQLLKKQYPERIPAIDFTDFGNLPFFHYLDHKPVASIEENFYEVGKQAAHLLFQMLKEDHSYPNGSSQDIKIPCKLVVH